MLIASKRLYPEGAPPPGETNASFYTRFCVWAQANGFNDPEFLLPIIHRKTTIEPFRFERRFASSGANSPTKEAVNSLAPWHYRLEWSGVWTKAGQPPECWREIDWKVHRYRSSLMVDLAAEIAGPERGRLSVLDVACHCGILALEFAEAGFGSVKGVDLRHENIQQAQFLKDAFGCSNVSFEQLNVRNLGGQVADIVFCGGLLYHVTFPVELMTDLFNATREILIFDSVCQNHPFSGFHLYDGKDINYSAEGEKAIELMPTYRAIVDMLKSVGFSQVYEILGDRAQEVAFYRDRSIRSFIATKPGCKFSVAVKRLGVSEAGQPTAPARATHVNELLALDGEAFVRAAYATILNRATDVDGLNNYLAELNAGVSKLEILSRLRNSAEGRRQNLPPAGLR